jgi:AmiR/NasT family two-component response regulator
VSTDVQNIIELLGPREVIGQAIALLMAENEMSRDAAFEMLVRGSSQSRRTVREVAAAMVGQPGDRTGATRK